MVRAYRGVRFVTGAQGSDRSGVPTGRSKSSRRAKAAERRRVSQMRQALALPGVIAAQFPGTCPMCKRAVRRGDPIVRVEQLWCHALCVAATG